MTKKLGIRLGCSALIVGLTLSISPMTTRADSVVATATVLAGTLAFTSVPAVPFGVVTIGSATQTATATQNVQILDARGTGAGWSLSLSGGPLTFNSQALPAATVGTPTSGCVGLPATCTPPVNNVASYPLTISTTAQKIFGAGSGSGLGAINVALPYSQDVPPTAPTGAYSATWTLTLGTSP